MFRYIIYFFLVLLAVGLIAFGFYFFKNSSENKKEMQMFSGPTIKTDKNLGKVLVIYYSLGGKTKDIAERIKNKTNADLYEIKTEKEIVKDFGLYIDVKKQLKDNVYPEVVRSFPNIDEYDVVFVGAPVWWYTMATPMHAFLEEFDFKGRKVVPFSTQGGNVGEYFNDFASKAKNAKIKQGEKFNNMSSDFNHELENKISVWINSLDI